MQKPITITTTSQYNNSHPFFIALQFSPVQFLCQDFVNARNQSSKAHSFRSIYFFCQSWFCFFFFFFIKLILKYKKKNKNENNPQKILVGPCCSKWFHKFIQSFIQFMNSISFASINAQTNHKHCHLSVLLVY